MAKKKGNMPEITEEGTVYTTLGLNTNFNGILKFERPLQINGHFEGEITSDSILLIGETATVKASIRAGIVVLGGQVTGNIDASKRVEMLSTGSLTGNIRTPKIQIADGVVFDGNCEMVFPEK